jgi:transposase
VSKHVFVGIDVAKELHWVCAIDDGGKTLLSRKLRNDPDDIVALVAELRELGGKRRVGIDVMGGIATLLTAMLLDAGESLVHVPGLAVNRARQGKSGGETKSDPKDALVIADQIRTRRDLRRVEMQPEILVELRLLVSQRTDLVHEQTRRLARLHDLLTAVHPGLEQQLDLTTKGGLVLVSRYVTPSEIRGAGVKKIARQLQRAGLRNADELARLAHAAAEKQAIALPAEKLTATLCRELAADALRTRERIERVDAQLEEMLSRHPDAALIRSLPGMGVVLTCEFLAEVGDRSRFDSADSLAAAAGLAPVLRQSGKMRFLRRPLSGNKGLKRVFYQSAFCSLHHPVSRAFYQRKRREGRRHHQALIALARRRVDVLWAMLRDRSLFECRSPRLAA